MNPQATIEHNNRAGRWQTVEEDEDQQEEEERWPGRRRRRRARPKAASERQQQAAAKCAADQTAQPDRGAVAGERDDYERRTLSLLLSLFDARPAPDSTRCGRRATSFGLSGRLPNVEMLSNQSAARHSRQLAAGRNPVATTTTTAATNNESVNPRAGQDNQRASCNSVSWCGAGRAATPVLHEEVSEIGVKSAPAMLDGIALSWCHLNGIQSALGRRDEFGRPATVESDWKARELLEELDLEATTMTTAQERQVIGQCRARCCCRQSLGLETRPKAATTMTTCIRHWPPTQQRATGASVPDRRHRRKLVALVANEATQNVRPDYVTKAAAKVVHAQETAFRDKQKTKRRIEATFSDQEGGSGKDQDQSSQTEDESEPEAATTFQQEDARHRIAAGQVSELSEGGRSMSSDAREQVQTRNGSALSHINSSSRLLLSSSACSRKSTKMRPASGRQLVVWGSLVLVILSLMATLNWPLKFISTSRRDAACESLGRCAGGLSQLTISASAATTAATVTTSTNSGDFDSTPTTTTRPTTTTTVPTTTDLAAQQFGGTQGADSDPRMTTEQTTATLNAPTTTLNFNARHEEQTTTSTMRPQQLVKVVVKRPATKKLAAAAKFEPSQQKLSKAKLKLEQSVGWQAIELGGSQSGPERVDGEIIVGRQRAPEADKLFDSNQHKVPSIEQREVSSSSTVNELRRQQSLRPLTNQLANSSSSSGWTIEPNYATPSQSRIQTSPSNLTRSEPVELPAQNAAQDEGRSMLESALRSALDDLITSAAGEPANQRPLQQSALTSRARTLQPLLELAHWNQRVPLPHRQRQQSNLPAASSQSAPSISLPPISHLLTPRNPFKLFASASSSPMLAAARHWPPVFASNPNSNQQHSAAANPNSAGSGWLSVASNNQRDNNNQRPNQGEPTYELESISSQLHNQVMAPSSLSLTGSLFAHTQSAEQLEKLVRAASQAGQLPRNSPPILPAIVSGPGGRNYPGFYIPAIEQESSNYNQMAPAASNSYDHEPVSAFGHSLRSPYLAQDSIISSATAGGGGAHDGGFFSTIPGTDYILHPDEVRAMIEIGESAWQKQRNNQDQQQQHASASGTHQVTSSNDLLNQHRAPEEGRNLMQENHLENLRNYAYFEQSQQQPIGKASGEHLQGASSATNEQQQQVAANLSQTNKLFHQHSSQLLGIQLNRALHRARSKALPAIIRVNDQDYVHWPLIRAQEEAQRGSLGQSSSVYQNVVPGGGQLNSMRHSQLSGQLSNEQQGLEQSPLRLATQLTADEIRQVENSILETLIMAQTLQQHHRHQQQQLASARKRQNAVGGATAQAGSSLRPKWLQLKSIGAGSKSMSFFGKRKRRRRNSANQTKQQQGPLSISSQAGGSNGKTLNEIGLSSSQQHLISLLPLLNVAASLPVVGIQHQNGASFASNTPASSSTNSNVDEQPTSNRLTTSGEISAELAESKQSQRLPTVMADQETNKPDLSSPDSLAAAASSGSAAMRSFLGLAATGPAEQLQFRLHTSAAQANDNETSLASAGQFGSRVRPALNSDSTKPVNRPNQWVKSTKEESDSSASSTAATADLLKEAKQQSGSGRPDPKQQFVTFVPVQNNRSKQISLYTKNQGGGALATSASTRTQHQRFNPVDWPAMVSDADYFPSGQLVASSESGNNKLQLDPLRKSPSAGSLTRTGSGKSSRELRKSRGHDQEMNMEPDEGDEHEHEPEDSGPKQRATAASIQVIQAPATRQGQFVTNQMKLQFSQDYQAREGVPIYNNNVRVAGALDRQRNLMTLAASG